MDGIAALVHNALWVVEKCEKYVRRDYQGLCLVRERGRDAPNWTKRDRQRLAFFSGSLSAIGRGILPPFLQGRQPLTFANDYIDGFPPPGRMAKYHDWLYPRIGEPKIEEWGTVALATAVLSNQIALLEPKIYAVKECVKRLIDEAYEASCDGRNWDSSESGLREQFHEEIFRLERARQAVAIAHQQPYASRNDSATSRTPERENAKPFSGGEMVFFPGRVELCGVSICSGRRSNRRWKVLNLLRVPQGKGFKPYSGDELAKHVGLATGNNTVAGLIRDLRAGITNAMLEQANIQCGDEDVILSGGPGYRLAECVSIRLANAPTTIEPDDASGDSTSIDADVSDGASVGRRAWILQELAKERRLKTPDVAEQFSCSAKTAQRDLTALKDEGLIEFVGTPRTGYYRLCRPANSSSSASE